MPGRKTGPVRSPEERLDELRRRVDEDPRDPKRYVALAQELYVQGRPDEAAGALAAYDAERGHGPQRGADREVLEARTRLAADISRDVKSNHAFGVVARVIGEGVSAGVLRKDARENLGQALCRLLENTRAGKVKGAVALPGGWLAQRREAARTLVAGGRLPSFLRDVAGRFSAFSLVLPSVVYGIALAASAFVGDSERLKAFEIAAGLCVLPAAVMGGLGIALAWVITPGGLYWGSRHVLAMAVAAGLVAGFGYLASWLSVPFALLGPYGVVIGLAQANFRYWQRHEKLSGPSSPDRWTLEHADAGLFVTLTDDAEGKPIVTCEGLRR